MNADRKKGKGLLRGAQATKQSSNASWGLLRPLGARNDKRLMTILLAIIFIAFALRLYHASTTLMWGDEGFSVFSASRDLYAITFEGKDVDPHPPLYYYLFHFWMLLSGTSKLSIRFFSIFFGTATVALVFILGRRLFSSRVGLISAALLTLAPFAVQYSQEVRMYALVMFLGALTTYVLVRWFDASVFRDTRSSPLPLVHIHPTADGAVQVRGAGQTITPHQKMNRFQDQSVMVRAGGLVFFLSMLLTQYSLYQSAFLFVAQGIFLLPFLKTRFRFILKWLGVSLAIILLFIPWLALHSGSAFTDIKDVAGDGKPMSLVEFLSRGISAIAIGPTVQFGFALTLAELFLTLLLIGIVLMLATKTATRSDWLLAVHIAFPMLLYYPIYYLAPLYRGRLFALALVPLVILLARSTTLITTRVKWAAVPIAFVFLSTYAYSLSSYFYSYSRYNSNVDDYIPAIRAIEQRAQAGDVVLFHAYWQIGYFLTEYHGAPLEYRFLDNARDVDYASEKSRNVWAIIQGLPIHGGEVTLDRAAYPYDETDFGQMRVLAFRAGNPGRVVNFSPPLQFENGIALLGYRASEAPLESGHAAVTLELQWQAAKKIPEDFTMSVRLIGTQGQVISQIDSQPVNSLSPTSSWNPGEKIIDRRGLPIPAAAPPGEYEIQMLVYELVDNRVLEVIAPENLRGNVISLGTISVIPAKK